MPGKFILKLNIRQKILGGIVVAMMGISLIGTISYRYLLQIEEKLALIEIVDDLAGSVLEVRRYEKNYLLYKQSDDYGEARRYLQRAYAAMDKIDAVSLGGGGQARFAELQNEVRDYDRIMTALSSPPAEAAAAKAMRESLRERGKSLVELSQELVAGTRARILHIVESLKRQLLFSIVGLLAAGVFFSVIIGRNILRALGEIEKATAAIAEGNLSLLKTSGGGHDESSRVLEAFNRMILELERRQEQLFREKKLSSIGVLASGVAHQLNNPLNNMSTSCQILIEELGQCDEAFARRMLGNIDGEVNRARDIVKGLLEFTRAKEFELKTASLAEVVERSVRLASSQVPAGIEIVRNIPPDLYLDMDFQKLQEVFINMLLNAVQAIKNPPGRISISAKADVHANRTWITVADTGSGISKEDLNRVFDPFFTTKDVGKGTGLGLSVAFGIIERHRGRISVDSQPGQGATFTIELPIKATGDDDA